MICVELRDNLSVYFDGELAEMERGRVAAHLAECPTCRDALDGMSRLSQLLHVGRRSDLPKSLWQRIEAVATQGTRPRVTFLSRLWFVRAASIAAGFVLYLGGYALFILSHDGPDEQQTGEPTYVTQVLAEAALTLADQGLSQERLAWLDQRPESYILEQLLEER